MNVTGPPESVNRRARPALLPWALVVLLLGLKLWLVGGVDLGKDEAAYWYWSRHLDAAYALLPFAAAAVADALAPGSDTWLRLPFHAAGAVSLWLLFRLCLARGLSSSRAGLAVAALALSHWWWHTSSYLHPDGFLVPAWLAVLLCSERAARGDGDGWWSAAGIAGGAAALSKYTGLVLAAGWFLPLVWTAWRGRRGPLVRAALPFALLTAPLLAQLIGTAFSLPRSLTSLSAVAPGPAPVRLGLFALAPLVYVSPLLWAALVLGAWRYRRAWAASTHLLWPGIAALVFFALFAVFRAQVKGNWVLPAFLGVWPLVFGAPLWRRRGAAPLLLAVGFLHLAVPAILLRSPDLATRLSGMLPAAWDATYAGTVSAIDRPREPTFTWTERVCEYHGWRDFGRRVDAAIDAAGLQPPVTLASGEYGLAFGLARYAGRVGAAALPRDPRFVTIAADAAEARVAAARAGQPAPPEAVAELARLPRRSPGCAPIEYVLYALSVDSGR